MKEFHSSKEPIKEPIEDFQEKLNILSDEVKALKLDNEHLKSQFNAQSTTSVNDLDLRTIKSIKKKECKKEH